MKVAVSATGESPESMVDPRFGRCNWFIITDTQTDQYLPVSNETNIAAVHGAGIQAAEKVSRLGVAAVITGKCGPKALQALQAAGVKVYGGAEGTVKEPNSKMVNFRNLIAEMK